MNKLVKISLLIAIIVLILILLIINGKSKNNTRFYLDDKYYNNGTAIKMNSSELENISSESFILFTYNSACGMARPCEDVFDSVLKDKKIDYITIHFDEFRNTKFYNTVKYAPSVLIIKNGEIIAYLDAEEDKHLDYYQNEKSFESWLRGRIYFNKKNK